MTRIVIYAYKQTSRSAQKLQRFLDEEDIDTVLVYPGKKYRPRDSDLILGWGAGEWPVWGDTVINNEVRWLNPSNVVMRSVNKIDTFRALRQLRVPIPEITSHSHVAQTWLDSGHCVLARTEVEGRDGSGLVVMTSPRQLVSAELYTLYEEKDAEFRVHVWGGVAFWGQIRVPIEDTENKYYRPSPDRRIRTSSNGWTLNVYNRDMPAICKLTATEAIRALGLNFGAVDIGWKRGRANSMERVTVYETNTCPELSDRTCAAYVEQIRRILSNE